MQQLNYNKRAMKHRIHSGNQWIYLLSLLLLAACQSNTDSTQRADRSTTLDTLTYEYKHFIRYSENLVRTTETTDTSYFSVSYPVFPDSVVNDLVRASLLGSDTVSVERAAEQFIEDFDRFMASDPFPRVWTSESHARVQRITPSYLGIVIDASSYTGGAHGNYATVFDHYDLASYQRLSLDDIVARPYRNELTAVAERYFRRQEGLAVDESLEDRYFFDDGHFSIPDNFALGSDSLLFLYNIYEIKPYVDGQTALRVPYSEIDRLLTDRGKRIINEIKQ